jgi:hypothetical protein
MSLFDSQTPKPVDLKGSTTTTAPQYLTNYLTDLAKAGQSALGTTTAEGVMTPYTGEQLIAKLPQNLTDLYKNAGTDLQRYQSPMDESLTALQDAAKGVSATDISNFYNPYEQDVVNEMSRQSQLNVQQGMLPALKAAFAGQGGFGSQRYAGALSQAMGDVQGDLLGQQAKLRAEGYKNAMDAALRERGYDIQTGQSLYGLGQAEGQAATSGVKALGDIGTQELGYEQSKLEAPLTRAQNIAQILRGYTYPTTVTENKQALPSAYAPSALQQIGSLGTLVGAASQGSAGKSITDFLNKVNFDGSTGDLRGGSTLITGGGNLDYGQAGTAATDESNPFPII